jgi:proteasome lid subunit RPN8/RPN11
MRWTDQSPVLPLQSPAVLAERQPDLHALLRAGAPGSGLLVAVSAAAIEVVLRHLGAHADEQGGLLLGEVYAEDGDPARSRAVRVTQAVPAEDFASTGVSLRMASGVWEAARGRLGPQEMVVGWYHSHPGLGAFFSHTDRDTQRAFFPHAYSVGWVVDLLRGESAWFVGADSSPPGQLAYGVGAGGEAGAVGEAGVDDAGAGAGTR